MTPTQRKAPMFVTDKENEKFSEDVSNFNGADPEATKYALEQFLKRRNALAEPAPEPVRIVSVDEARHMADRLMRETAIKTNWDYNRWSAMMQTAATMLHNACNNYAAPVREPAPVPTEWIDDEGRIKWCLWRIKDLEQQLAGRPAYTPQQPAPVPLLTKRRTSRAIEHAYPKKAGL